MFEAEGDAVAIGPNHSRREGERRGSVGQEEAELDGRPGRQLDPAVRRQGHLHAVRAQVHRLHVPPTAGDLDADVQRRTDPRVPSSISSHADPSCD